MCMCVEVSLWESVLLLHHVSPEDQTQIAGLSGKRQLLLYKLWTEGKLHEKD